jgi:hypothetical protein
MRPEEFAQTQPEFLLEEYFQGRTLAWGIFQDRSGKPQRYFTVDIEGRQEGDEFVLHETFAFRDGERSERTWRIRKLDAHRYEGRAEDVAGVATGQRYGNALNWQYDLLIEARGREWKVHFNDWMFLHDEGVVVNRARMSKFGFPLGEILLFFRKG